MSSDPRNREHRKAAQTEYGVLVGSEAFMWCPWAGRAVVACAPRYATTQLTTPAPDAQGLSGSERKGAGGRGRG